MCHYSTEIYEKNTIHNHMGSLSLARSQKNTWNKQQSKNIKPNEGRWRDILFLMSLKCKVCVYAKYKSHTIAKNIVYVTVAILNVSVLYCSISIRSVLCHLFLCLGLGHTQYIRIKAGRNNNSKCRLRKRQMSGIFKYRLVSHKSTINMEFNFDFHSFPSYFVLFVKRLVHCT